MNKRTEGTRFERIAGAYLKEEGYRILEENFRCRYAEIDLVCRDGRYLVFVEVKARSALSKGMGYEAVDWRKQRRICLAARVYLKRYRVDPSAPVRFDVVSIDNGRIRLIRNAFAYRE